MPSLVILRKAYALNPWAEIGHAQAWIRLQEIRKGRGFFEVPGSVWVKPMGGGRAKALAQEKRRENGRSWLQTHGSIHVHSRREDRKNRHRPRRAERYFADFLPHLDHRTALQWVGRSSLGSRLSLLSSTLLYIAPGARSKKIKGRPRILSFYAEPH